MAKIILLAMAVWLLVVIARQYLRNINASQQNPPADANAQPEAIVKCRYCGVHVLVAESVQQGEHHYCCSAHRDADA